MRDALRTRESVLDAAERLFAERGFDGVSLQEIGAAAGLSRGTPSYFYRSKAELYRSVLERCYGQVREAVRAGRSRALASGHPPEVVLAGVVGDYFDFIAGHPHFVRLVEWEALGGGAHLRELPPHAEALAEAVTALAEEMGFDPSRRDDAAQLVLSILALCWFPHVHGATVLPALGADPRDPAFLAARRRHVIDLVLQGVRRELAAPAASLAQEPAP